MYCGMNDETIVAYYAKSLYGHDAGSIYVILRCDGQYVYLADGNNKLCTKPKKKKLKHVQLIKKKDETVASLLENGQLPTDVQIKYAIKRYKLG